MTQAIKRLGQLFIDAGKISENQLDEALYYKREHNVYLGKALTSLKLISDLEVIEMVSSQLQIPSVDPLSYNIHPETLN